MYVTGPPGSGKTTFILNYVTQQAYTNKKNGMIVQYQSSGKCEIIFVKGVNDAGSNRLKLENVSKPFIFDYNLHELVGRIVEERKDSFYFSVFNGMIAKYNLQICC